MSIWRIGNGGMMMSQYGNTALQERIARRKKQARKRRMKKVILLLILLVAAAAAFFAIRGISAWIEAKKVTPMEFSFQTENTAVAAVEPVIEYNKNFGIGVRYPSTGNEALDAVIQEDAKALMQSFQTELGEYKAETMETRASVTMDFDAYQQGNALSVIYHIQKKLPENQTEEERTKTFVYDTSAARAVTAQDIFREDYLAAAADFVKKNFEGDDAYREKMNTEQFEKHSQAAWENFSAIAFEDAENVTLIFDSGTLFDTAVTVNLPLKKVFDAMQLNLTGYEPPKSLVDPEKPMVALTFDDGPYAPVTSRILDALEKVGGRATFFVLGERAADGAEVMKRAVELGCEIGNHSYDHANFAKLSADAIADQVKRTSDLVKQAIGQPTVLVRAPYGSINQTVRESVGAPLINWSIDTLDWKTKNPDKIVPEILNNVGDGDVVLMHDIYKTSAEAAETVIPELVKRGYQLVTISELMEARGITMTPGKTYSQAYKK